MFSCVWLHFKKCFEKCFLVFGCVLENTIENTFSTCCSHFLTFSRLPNKYIISFIPQYRNTNKTQKKKIIKSVKLREERRERGTGFDDGLRSARCFARSQSMLSKIAIDTLCDRDWRSASRDRNRHKGEIAIDGAIFLPLRVYESFFLSLFLPLHVCELLSLHVLVSEVI